MNKRIGILGCGWLGLPLALSFIEAGYKVNGTTTSTDKLIALEKVGIQPFLIRLLEDQIVGEIDAFLKGVDVLIINVPPKLRRQVKENYVAKMTLLLHAVKKAGIVQLIFISSTSVYGDAQGALTETSPTHPTTESGKQLREAELLFNTDAGLETTVVRFGGLIGPNRHPVYQLAGKKGLSNGNDYINLVHLDDCIAILLAIVIHNYRKEVFNGVYPYHPTKASYYAQEAKRRGLVPPEYQITDTKGGKQIDSSNLIRVKKFRFNTHIES